MATQPVKAPPITVDQYEQFEGYPGLRDELIYGEIVMSPQPKPWHQQIAENVQVLLRDAIRPLPFVAKQDSNIRFREANSMSAPDVFVVSRSEWRSACESDTYLDHPPVLAVEVLSAANRKARVEQKIDLYLGQGVAQVWVIYPRKKLIRVCILVNGRREITEWHAGAVIPLPAPLQGTISVQDIFKLD